MYLLLAFSFSFKKKGKKKRERQITYKTERATSHGWSGRHPTLLKITSHSPKHLMFLECSWFLSPVFVVLLVFFSRKKKPLQTDCTYPPSNKKHHVTIYSNSNVSITLSRYNRYCCAIFRPTKTCESLTCNWFPKSFLQIKYPHVISPFHFSHTFLNAPFKKSEQRESIMGCLYL